MAKAFLIDNKDEGYFKGLQSGGKVLGSDDHIQETADRQASQRGGRSTM